MTVSSTTAKVTGSGNGVAFTFSFSPMVIFATSDLEVTHVATDGTETTLVEGSGAANYSVALTDPTNPKGSTGSVTYPADSSTAMATGESIIMKRVLPLDQQTDLQNQAAYFPETLETQLDKIVMQVIQLQEELDRTPKLLIGSGTDTASGAMQVPSGATGSRPSSPFRGMLRFNTTLSQFEGYDGTSWVAL